MSWSKDILAVLRGLDKVRRALASHQQRELERLWKNSSLKSSVGGIRTQTEEKLSDAVIKQESATENLQSAVNNIISGTKTAVGLVQKQASNFVENTASKSGLSSQSIPFISTQTERAQRQDEFDQEWQELMEEAAVAESSSSSHNKDLPEIMRSPASTDSFVQSVTAASIGMGASGSVDRPRSLRTNGLHYDMTSKAGAPDDHDREQHEDKSTKKGVGRYGLPVLHPPKGHRLSGLKPIAKTFEKVISGNAKERKVPGSRLGRLASFGGLAAGLGMGAVAEITRRGLGLNKGQDGKNLAILDKNPFLTEANAERIVNTLCRVRGAALKIGQMLSIQDNSLINPEIQHVFERVRQSADFMPTWQMEKVISSELGADWKSKFSEFDERPFAAASIGQVHRGTTLDNRNIAMKIQYPGVAESINSDINNLMSVLSVWNILPEGMYVDSVMRVARRELAWECDYIREAQCSDRFRQLLKDDPVFYVPEVIWDLSSQQVLTSELVSGVPLDRLVDSDQDTRNWVCENMLRLCLTELFQFNFMQTDPNWSNFLYDAATDRLTLLDFGASREFSKKFTDEYIRIIKSASVKDREGMLVSSRKLGFLTGFESKAMESAHVEAVTILGEAFSQKDLFDFGSQSTAKRINDLIPIMLKHRLTPPPEETYSLHRKMAGCFLLCAKLKAKIECRTMFDQMWDSYQFGSEELTLDNE